MPTLRLLPAGTAPAGQSSELFCCAYTSDGAFVLSGGWDGHLRLWETAKGGHVKAFRASDKQLSACAVSPDGKLYVGGATDGMLSMWDTATGLGKLHFVAHTRPISTIIYGPDDKTVVTAAWDNAIHLWHGVRSHDYRAMSGHRDIVSGCKFTPDGGRLLSWSYDGMLNLWDVAAGRSLAVMSGHQDRILSGDISPDGKWAATGSRDGTLKLWLMETCSEAATIRLRGAVQACLFLLDGQFLVAADNHGRLSLHTVPEMKLRGEVLGRSPLHQARLAPAGNQIALAGTDGRIHLVALDGVEQSPMLTGTIRSMKRVATGWQRMLGRSQLVYMHEVACPACRGKIEVPEPTAGLTLDCAQCGRKLQLSGVVRMKEEKPAGA